VLKVLSHFSIVKIGKILPLSVRQIGMLTEKRIQTTQSNSCLRVAATRLALIGKKRGIPFTIVDLDRSKPNRFTLLGQTSSSGGIDRQHVGGSLKTSVPTVWCHCRRDGLRKMGC